MAGDWDCEFVGWLLPAQARLKLSECSPMTNKAARSRGLRQNSEGRGHEKRGIYGGLRTVIATRYGASRLTSLKEMMIPISRRLQAPRLSNEGDGRDESDRHRPATYVRVLVWRTSCLGKRI